MSTTCPSVRIICDASPFLAALRSVTAELQSLADALDDLRLDYLARLTWEDDGGPSLPLCEP